MSLLNFKNINSQSTNWCHQVWRVSNATFTCLHDGGANQMLHIIRLSKGTYQYITPPRPPIYYEKYQ